MMNRGFTRMRRAGNFLLNQTRGRAAILLYHRIADLIPDPQLLCVRPGCFQEHLEVLRRDYHILSLAGLVAAVRNNSVPRRAVVLTVDDGYVDNLWNAEPLLAKYECPATIFVASGFVGTPRELLSDELERILFQTPTLPQSLQLTVQGRSYEWGLGRAGRQDLAWDVTRHDDPSPRHSCYRNLHRLLTPLSQAEREDALTELFRWSANPTAARSDRRVMNPDELRQVTQSGAVEIGAHTVHHLMLGRQPESIQREEIFESRIMLEMVLGRPVPTFAYPYGDPASIGEIAPLVARQAGFHASCANAPGLVNQRTPLQTLPRFLVRNWSGKEFAGRLARFFCLS